MSNFKREQRYSVFKLKNLTEEQKQRLYDLQMELGPWNDVPECVVVEHDWANYEETWAAIQAISEGGFVPRTALVEQNKQLQQEVDAQAAHLHNLHEALKAFSNVKAPGGFARDTREYDKAMGKCWQNLWAVVNTQPEQALLAVKAEAARAGWVNCALQLTDEPTAWIKIHADQYAEQVLKGEVKL